MNTEKLERFLIGFENEIMPRISEDNQGLVYEISQSLAEDDLVSEVANMSHGSGAATGRYMGIPVRTFSDFRSADYRPKHE